MGHDGELSADLVRLRGMFWEGYDLVRAGEKERGREVWERAIEEARRTGNEAEVPLFEAAGWWGGGKSDGAAQAFDGEVGPRLTGLAAFVRGRIAERGGTVEEQLVWFRAAGEDATTGRRGVALNHVGVLYAEQGDHDRAIANYLKALEVPGYHAPGKSLYNIGLSYAKKGEYDDAIAHYEKAIGTAGFEAVGHAWNDMGLAYAKKGDPGRAIRCYKKALGSPGYDARGNTWNNMGLAYGEKGNFGRAIEYYEKAMQDAGYETPGHALFNMGLAYKGMGDWKQAIKLMRRAEASYRKRGQAGGVAEARMMREALGVPPEFRGEATGVLVESAGVMPLDGLGTGLGADGEGAETPERRALKKLTWAEGTVYQRYDRGKSSEGYEDAVTVLRGWSSATPLVEGAGMCRGGGYFLKWRGKGMVVDPGLQFMESFRERFHLREVDAVVVTHDHPDHNFDLGALDDALYELYRATEGKRGYRYALVYDDDTARGEKLRERAKHRFPPQRLDISQRQLDPKANVDLTKAATRLPFRIRYFEARHGAWLKGATGVKVECMGMDRKAAAVVGFTGDTEYFEELCGPDYLGESDVLVAHISQPEDKELVDPTVRKKLHLGYRGTAELIKGVRPKMAIIGEFWAGLADIRIELVQGLRKLTGVEAILPGSIGLAVKVATQEVRCTGCGEWVKAGEISVTPATEAFGPLAYTCRRCRV